MAYFCAGALVIIISILYSFKIDDIIEFILDNILLVNDDLRGLDTGASGRIDLWRKALDIWLDNPLFGVGYEQAVFYIGFGLGAHNMILELLADLGAFGLICFLLFSILAARNALVLWRTGQRLMASAVAVMLIVYYAYGLFEGRAINVGNPLSSCFFLITFASCGTLRQLPNQP